MSSYRWDKFGEKQKKYTSALANLLPELRAKAKVSQIDLCKMIGISRQSYSLIEGKHREMMWTTYLSLILYFDYNLDTREMLRASDAYPEELFLQINEGKDPEQVFNTTCPGDMTDILRELDEPALHALKTMLLVEYARCKKISSEAVIKTFDGLTVFGDYSDTAAEQALKNIRKKKK